ncbi:Phosphoheptose isomerase 1 [bacterium HR08]|nr:Phosphoheptose isomerase 1 [bacterium HR08]
MTPVERIRELARESVRVKERFFEERAEDVARAAELMIAALRAGGKILLFGNGGSAADAQHIAAELVNRYRRSRPALAAMALTTDTSVLTSIANDVAFEEVFSRQIEALGEPGDVAVAISTSGRSPNVVRAVETARRLGLRTIGLLGRDGGLVAPLVDVPLVVPVQETPRIQEVHITLGHILCELIESAFSETP